MVFIQLQMPIPHQQHLQHYGRLSVMQWRRCRDRIVVTREERPKIEELTRATIWTCCLCVCFRRDSRCLCLRPCLGGLGQAELCDWFDATAATIPAPSQGASAQKKASSDMPRSGQHGIFQNLGRKTGQGQKWQGVFQGCQCPIRGCAIN